MNRRDAEDAGMSAGAIVLTIIGVFLVILLVTYLTAGFSFLTADTRGKTDVREKTVANGNYRIAAYDKFYDKCNAVVANEVKQDTSRAALQQATTPKEKQDARINLAALQNQHAELATEYNSDSSKAGTQAQFKASDLPYRIDPRAKDTQCAR